MWIPQANIPCVGQAKDKVRRPEGPPVRSRGQKAPRLIVWYISSQLENIVYFNVARFLLVRISYLRLNKFVLLFSVGLLTINKISILYFSSCNLLFCKFVFLDMFCDRILGNGAAGLFALSALSSSLLLAGNCKDSTERNQYYWFQNNFGKSRNCKWAKEDSPKLKAKEPIKQKYNESCMKYFCKSTKKLIYKADERWGKSILLFRSN